MAIEYAQYKDGKITFAEDTNFEHLFVTRCLSCVNQHGDVPACIPPDGKRATITVSTNFDESKANCLDHTDPKIKPYMSSNMVRVIFESDQ